MFSTLIKYTLRFCRKKILYSSLFSFFVLLPSLNLLAATTADHNKQVVGYITQWDPWKDTKAGFVTKGAANHLNVDMGKYTILNYSFFGVAVDGSLHSGDFRNKNIYKPGTVQQPGELLNGDIYSSWDYYLIYGEIAPSYNFTAAATAQGFAPSGGGWTNTITGLSGSMPIPVKKEGGQPGLIEHAHTNGVKVMASIGGWSMCRHFPEMAADPIKRAKFIENVRKLMAIGFDGIDLDWEYPGPFSGMNFTGSQADYGNFLTLVKEIRTEIGPDKLITAAFSAATNKLEGFDWVELDKYMDYYNMMTYDFNGGWSNIAGHNSPLYPYSGAEVPQVNWDETAQWMLNKGIDNTKINMGVPFYGRGVVTADNADLNAPTDKKDIVIQPDGPVSSAGDFVNWPKDVYDATPNYFFIKQKQADGWTVHWDDEAKVPYMTKGKYFLSYDNEDSVALKAQYVNDYGLGGTIVWQVAGDQQCLGGYVMHGKLPKCNQLNPTLANKLNDVFALGCQGCPIIRITSPTSSDQIVPGSNVSIQVEVSDPDGQVVEVEYYANGSLIGSSQTAPFSFTWMNVAEGNYDLTAIAYDNLDNSKETPKVSISVNQDHLKPVVAITAPEDQIVQDVLSQVTFEASASYADGTITSVDFTINNNTIAATSGGNNLYMAQWLPNRYGDHQLYVTATNNDGFSQSDSKVFSIIQCSGTPWEASKVYVGGNEVLYKDKIYRAKWWTQGETPDTSQVWKFIKDCDPTIPDPVPVVTVISPSEGAVIDLETNIEFIVNAADANGTITKVEFYVNNTQIDTVNSVPYSTMITNAAAGSYTLQATATDNDGNIGSATVNVSVQDPNTNVPPTANFDTAINILTVDFSDLSSDSDGQVVAWSWNFGDGSTATTANPSHTYSTAGTYTVSLIVTDNDNATSTPVSKSVTVSDSTGSNCSGINEYPVGIGSYVGGSQVQNNGSLYHCKPFPYEGWCNQGGAYAPGEGWAWGDAWILVGSCQ